MLAKRAWCFICAFQIESHVHAFLNFFFVVFADFFFDMPWGFAELMAGLGRLPPRFGFDRMPPFDEFLWFPGLSDCIRLLLRGVTSSDEGCASNASAATDKIVSETFFGRWGLGFFPAALETFDEWGEPEDALTASLSAWEGVVLSLRDDCLVIRWQAWSPELVRGEADA
jgi:hypothetical protein